MKYISFRILIIFPFVVCCSMFLLRCNGGSSPVYPSDRSAEDNPPLCIFHCSEPSLVQCGVYYGCDCDHCKAGPDSSRIWEPAPLSVSSNSSICTFCISYTQLPVWNISTSILRRITCQICLIFANALLVILSTLSWRHTRKYPLHIVTRNGRTSANSYE